MPARILISLLLCAGGLFSQAASKREPPDCRALLIGNSLYAKVAHVDSAAADVDSVASRLREVGCSPDRIDIRKNLNGEDLRQAIEDKFFPSIQAGEIVIVYFAGHAVQAEQENYLLGVDFDPHTKDELRDVAYLLNRFKKRIEDRNPALFLMLLDAAYDDQTLAAIPNYAPGLAEFPSSIRNGIVLYSTGKDQPAPAGAGKGESVLSRALSSLIARPGLTATDLMTGVSESIQNQTTGAQHPYMLLGYTGRFQFVPIVEEVKVIKQPESGRRQHTDDREEYVLIPAGTFKMGCVPATTDCEANEKPQHTVSIAHPFWMGENEVKVVSYRRWVTFTHQKMPTTPLGFDWKNESLPISMVTWEKANQYCGWVGGRLPTEAEWEFAARAGHEDRAYPMTDFSKARDAANFKGKSGNDLYEYVAPVQQFNKNDFGLYDMSGNVWEWVFDWYSPTYYQEPALQDPTGPSGGKEKVMRGGSFDSDPVKHLRLSYRDKSGGAQNKIGFRCMLPDSPEVRAKLH